MAVNIKSAGKQEATQAQEGKNLLFGTHMSEYFDTKFYNHYLYTFLMSVL